MILYLTVTAAFTLGVIAAALFHMSGAADELDLMNANDELAERLDRIIERGSTGNPNSTVKAMLDIARGQG